jgi:hypothetical protein
MFAAPSLSLDFPESPVIIMPMVMKHLEAIKHSWSHGSDRVTY